MERACHASRSAVGYLCRSHGPVGDGDTRGELWVGPGNARSPIEDDMLAKDVDGRPCPERLAGVEALGKGG